MRVGLAVATAALCAAIGASPIGQTVETADLAAIARIREEGLNRSQVMDTMFWLTDRYGPRLNASPEFEEAGDWAAARLASWGMSNVRKERFRSGPRWSLVRFHATMTDPRVMPIIGLPAAWSAGTNGILSADVVRPVIASAADAAKYRGTLRGKIVLAQSARAVRMLEHGDGTVLRYGDHDGRWEKEVMTPPAATSAPTATSSGGGRGGGATSFDLAEFYRSEGVAALFERGPGSDLSAGGSNLSWTQQRTDGGTIVTDEAGPPQSIPQVTIAVEHYNRMVRLVERGVPVRVELLVDVAVNAEAEPSSFNIIGEIPGTNRADEIVLLGAHFDSWHGGTGATDNAAGVAAMMEALRILKASGLQPARTVRIGLWGNEEGGLVGSRTYVRDYLGTSAAPRPEHSKTSVYFNLDNGTGRIRGIWTQGNARAAAIFSSWSRPLADLGVTLISPRSVSQTDHVPFEAAGVPAFQFVQERYEYNSRTHHTSMDYLDRVQPDDLKQMAVVTAIFAWHAATRSDLLPRTTNGR